MNGKQIAHFIADDAIELRLTRALIRGDRERLRADERVTLRASTASDWIIVRFAAAKDVGFIVELAEKAAAVHRAEAGAPSKPPPAGAELERRRRFH